MSEVEKLCERPHVVKVVAEAREYPRQSQRIWNPQGDRPTQQMFMGLVAMDKDTTRQNLALAMDLAVKCGLVVKDKQGKWVEAPDADDCRVYLVGDVKTTDLLEKGIYNLDRKHGLSDNMDQFAEKEVIRNTLHRFIIQPGDWHAGLSCLQALYTVFWDDILQPIVAKLKWKRVGKDVRECYYNASRLLRVVYHQVLKLMMQIHITVNWSNERTSFLETSNDTTEANWFCHLAITFEQWLKELESSTDKWLRACSFFVRMARDFFFC